MSLGRHLNEYWRAKAAHDRVAAETCKRAFIDALSRNATLLNRIRRAANKNRPRCWDRDEMLADDRLLAGYAFEYVIENRDNVHGSQLRRYPGNDEFASLAGYVLGKFLDDESVTGQSRSYERRRKSYYDRHGEEVAIELADTRSDLEELAAHHELRKTLQDRDAAFGPQLLQQLTTSVTQHGLTWLDVLVYCAFSTACDALSSNDWQQIILNVTQLRGIAAQRNQRLTRLQTKLCDLLYVDRSSEWFTEKPSRVKGNRPKGFKRDLFTLLGFNQQNELNSVYNRVKPVLDGVVNRVIASL